MNEENIFNNFVSRGELNSYKRKVQNELEEIKEAIKELKELKIENESKSKTKK